MLKIDFINRHMLSEKSEKITKFIFFIIKGIIIALPLFFLPWHNGTGADNLSKWNLLIIFLPFVLFLLVISFLEKNNLKYSRTPLDCLIIIFFVIYLAASLFSIDVYSSFFGSVFILPFFGFISLVLIYFLINYFCLNIIRIAEVLKFLIFSWLISVYGAFIIFVSLRFGIIGNESMLVRFFNSASGNLEDFAVYISIISVFLFVFISKKSLALFFPENWLQLIIKISAGIGLFFLAIINFTLSWVLLLIGLFFIIYSNFIIRAKEGGKTDRGVLKNFFNWLKEHSWSILFFTISLFFLMANLSSSNLDFSYSQARGLALDFNHTARIAGRALKENPLFGYGPENFSYVFSKFRQADMNLTDYWYVRFNHSFSTFFEIFFSAGLAGLIVFLSILFQSLFHIFNNFKLASALDKNSEKIKYFTIAISSALFCLIIALFISNFNVNLHFLFWLFLSVLFALTNILKSENKLKTNEFILGFKNKKGFYYQGTVLLIFFFIASWLYLAGINIKYLGAYYYGQKTTSEGSLLKAVNLNPDVYEFQINLSKLYLYQANEELRKPSDMRDVSQIKDLMGKSVEWARKAAITAPDSVAAQEVLAIVYKQFGVKGPGNKPLSIPAFERAINLEPTNPVLLAELGKVYFENNDNKNAIFNFEEALKMKNNYDDAALYLAKAYEEEMQTDKALAVLNNISETQNSDIVYEIGKIYYNQKRYDQAINKFKETLALSPNHANALYSLGLLYSDLNDKKLALYYLKKVLSLNPENIEVKSKIKELEK